MADTNEMTCQRFREIAAWSSEAGHCVEEALYFEWLEHAAICEDCCDALRTLVGSDRTPDLLAERICLQVAAIAALAKHEQMTVQDLPAERFELFAARARQLAAEWDKLDPSTTKSS